MPANPIFAETDQERELLVRFRTLTPLQQRAFLKMLKAMAAFSKTMQEGADHAHA